jgi:hypothetical protein
MTERMKDYSAEELNEDLRRQERLSRYQRRRSKLGSADFAKDPS